jgi:hypothetical protein
VGSVNQAPSQRVEGIILIAADELMIVHPSAEPTVPTTAVILGGLVLYLVGNTLFKRALWESGFSSGSSSWMARGSSGPSPPITTGPIWPCWLCQAGAMCWSTRLTLSPSDGSAGRVTSWLRPFVRSNRMLPEWGAWAVRRSADRGGSSGNERAIHGAWNLVLQQHFVPGVPSGYQG